MEKGITTRRRAERLKPLEELREEINSDNICARVKTQEGTTIKGIYQLEDEKLRTVLIKAVVAATEKCTDIGYNWNNENR